MSKQIQLALNQIYKMVEPLTRYGRETLNLEGNPLVREVKGKTYWRFSVNISNTRESGSGELPYRAVGVDSEEKLEEVATQIQKRAYDDLPKRLESWLRINERLDSQLEKRDCFDGTKTFGYEFKCSTCKAEGWVTCPKCDGRGFNKCLPCEGKGHFDCTNCKGLWGLLGPSGKVKCKNCDGKGKKDGQRCQPCQGKGKVVCTVCNGRLIVDHKDCGGRGVINCRKCDTTGRITCEMCKGARYFHFLRTIECNVSANWNVEFKDNKSEVTQQFVNRDLNGLRQLANVSQLPASLERTSVQREYDFNSIITEITVNAAGEKKEIIGYGAKSWIYDFKKIVPALLKDDLAALKNAVVKTPLRLWGNPTSLTTATKQFLESKVNIDIDNPTHIQQNIIDKNYVNQVKEFVPSALRRIFGAKIGLAFLFTALIPILIFPIIFFGNLAENVGVGIFIVPAITAIIAWLLCEKRTRDYLVLLFNDNPKKKIDILFLLKRYYVLWVFRGLAFLLTSVILGVMFVITMAQTNNDITTTKIISEPTTKNSPTLPDSDNSKFVADKEDDSTNTTVDKFSDESDSNSNKSDQTKPSIKNEDENGDERTDYGNFRVVTRDGSGLNIRKYKDLNSEEVSFVSEGDEVTILKYDTDFVYIHYDSGRIERGKWCWVEDEDGNQGWAWGHYLTNDPNFIRK